MNHLMLSAYVQVQNVLDNPPPPSPPDVQFPAPKSPSLLEPIIGPFRGLASELMYIFLYIVLPTAVILALGKLVFASATGNKDGVGKARGGLGSIFTAVGIALAVVIGINIMLRAWG